jgi:hypothetical protein
MKEIAASVIARVFLGASVIFLSMPQTSGQDDNCDPSYPDVCMPPYPPDQDCHEVAYKDFRVLPPVSRKPPSPTTSV